MCLLAPHLTAGNLEGVLEQARGQTKRQVEELVAALRPKPDAAALIRRLPDRGAASPPPSPSAEMPTANCPESVLPPSSGSPAAVAPADNIAPMPLPPAPPPRVVPLAPGRYRLQITIDRATEEKLRRARDLMRHSNPSGDIAAILDRALDLLLVHLERTKHAATSRPRRFRSCRAGSRHIPARVRREVWRRDGGRCAFVGPAGRCRETALLEFHHVQAFADGGPPTVENIELRCRAHNQYEAALQFGEFVARERPAPYSVRTELPLLLY